MALADQGLNSNTLYVYKAGLRWHWTREMGPSAEGDNPLDSEWIRLLLKGIANDRAVVERNKWLTSPGDNALAAETVEQMQDRHREKGDKLAMLYAAICLGVCGLLRSNELTGTPAHPSRAARIWQLRFFDSHEGEMSPVAAPSSPLPDHCRYSIPFSKTQQRGRGREAVISAPFAVAALWEWRRRQGERDPHSHLFSLTLEGKPLTIYALMRHVRSELSALGLPSSGITSKCFRRGGATSLSRAGVSPEDISNAGGWRDPRMHHRYTTKGEKIRRAMEANHRLGTAPPQVLSTPPAVPGTVAEPSKSSRVCGT